MTPLGGGRQKGTKSPFFPFFFHESFPKDARDDVLPAIEVESTSSKFGLVALPFQPEAPSKSFAMAATWVCFSSAPQIPRRNHFDGFAPWSPIDCPATALDSSVVEGLASLAR